MAKSIAMNHEKPHPESYAPPDGADGARSGALAKDAVQLLALRQQIKDWGKELGFQRVGIADIDLGEHEAHLQSWLAEGMQGSMDYMQRHGSRRSRPAELVPGTLRVISGRMDYLPAEAIPAQQVLEQPAKALISRYALGRDYHRLMRQRLQKLATHIEGAIGAFGYRVFVDSAPVLEKALAAKAGLGWIGKHSNLLNRSAGSWFFLGEIYTDLPLPVDDPVENHCGSCSRCIEVCPTGAIVAPYRVDARRCVSYLTIELRTSIPVELRPLLGNRIFGCDDCQFVCPWNRFAQFSAEDDFSPRPGLDAPQLLELLCWTEQEFLDRTEGSAIRRIGHSCWLRNIAVALGNAPPTPAIRAGLRAQLGHPDEMVREHLLWALERQSGAA
jgi:epoxyqueuosine reductase